MHSRQPESQHAVKGSERARARQAQRSAPLARSTGSADSARSLTLHAHAAHPLLVNRERGKVVADQRDRRVEQRPLQDGEHGGVGGEDLNKGGLEQLVACVAKQSGARGRRASVRGPVWWGGCVWRRCMRALTAVPACVLPSGSYPAGGGTRRTGTKESKQARPRSLARPRPGPSLRRPAPNPPRSLQAQPARPPVARSP